MLHLGGDADAWHAHVAGFHHRYKKKDFTEMTLFYIRSASTPCGDAPARQVWVEEVRELGLIIHLLIDPAYIRPIYISQIQNPMRTLILSLSLLFLDLCPYRTRPQPEKAHRPASSCAWN